MNLHELALALMALQGLMGAFDTVYHHELTEALPRRPSARRELGIHAMRALLYSGLFIGLSSWVWGGLWSAVLLIIIGVEVVLTLWDFVTEDQTRLLPASERVTHTLLAINGGAFTVLLLLTVPQWWQLPDAFIWQPHGALSIFLAASGIGVGLSGIRDALAWASRRSLATGATRETIDFGSFHEDSPSTFLVTGGTGFVGSELVESLLGSGHQVIVLTRNPRHAAWEFGGRVRCIARMMELPADTRIDVIVHLAGARIIGLPWTRNRKRQLVYSRTNITDQLMAWIETAHTRPRLLLAASAIGYYGIQQAGDTEALAEDSPPSGIFMSRLCQIIEQKATEVAKLDVKVCILRFGLVLGNQGVLPMLMLPIKLGLGGRLGSGSQWVSWIHVDDLIRAIGHLCCKSASGEVQDQKVCTYNLTSPDAVTQAGFSKVAATLSHRPCWFPTPGTPFRLLMGEQSQLMLDGQRVIPQQLLEEDFRFRYSTLECALRDLL